MKNLTYIICILAVFLNACNKNDDPVLTYFKCKIDGDVFEKEDLQYPADNLVEGELDLTFECGERRLILGVLEFNGNEGTYTANWVHYDNGSSDFYGDMGTVTITEVNKKRDFISGTFSGSCSPPGGGQEIQITEGEFVMEYY